MGELYLIHFTDDYSRYTKSYLMKNRESRTMLKCFQVFMIDLDKPIKEIKTDHEKGYEASVFVK